MPALASSGKAQWELQEEVPGWCSGVWAAADLLWGPVATESSRFCPFCWIRINPLVLAQGKVLDKARVVLSSPRFLLEGAESSGDGMRSRGTRTQPKHREQEDGIQTKKPRNSRFALGSDLSQPHQRAGPVLRTGAPGVFKDKRSRARCAHWPPLIHLRSPEAPQSLINAKNRLRAGQVALGSGRC